MADCLLVAKALESELVKIEPAAVDQAGVLFGWVILNSWQTVAKGCLECAGSAAKTA